MRLIDADKLQERAYQMRFDTRITEGGLALINYLLSEEPTVDPVKHGRWKYNIILGWCSVGTEATADYVCSVCGWHTEKMPTNYCPHCGAMMDGENDEID